MQIMVQQVELLAVAAGKSHGQHTVVLTIRPDKNSFRPHNIEISRAQGKRLLRDLRTVLANPVSAILIGLFLAS